MGTRSWLAMQPAHKTVPEQETTADYTGQQTRDTSPTTATPARSALVWCLRLGLRILSPPHIKSWLVHFQQERDGRPRS